VYGELLPPLGVLCVARNAVNDLDRDTTLHGFPGDVVNLLVSNAQCTSLAPVVLVDFGHAVREHQSF
jgi:hypothetical protein